MAQKLTGQNSFKIKIFLQQSFKKITLLEKSAAPKFGQSRIKIKVDGHLPAIHRSPITIIFLRITTLLTLFKKVRKGGKLKEFGIKHHFHMGKALHA